MLLLIGLLASLVICLQNAGTLMSFSWALVHGAGAAALLAFLPAAAGLAMLWAGYVVLTRAKVRKPAVVLSMYALGLVLVNEALLPATPLKTWRGSRALERVDVRNVRDELILSRAGNPIGIRVTWEAVVPRTGDYLISASMLSPSDSTLPWPLSLGRSLRRTVEPLPPAGRDGIFELLQEGTVYAFSQELVPNFLSSAGTEEVCRDDVATTYVSEADVAAALEKSSDMRYRGEVHVSGPYNARFVVRADFLTSRGYDVAAMYRTHGRCGD